MFHTLSALNSKYQYIIFNVSDHWKLTSHQTEWRKAANRAAGSIDWTRIQKCIESKWFKGVFSLEEWKFERSTCLCHWRQTMTDWLIQAAWPLSWWSKCSHRGSNTGSNKHFLRSERKKTERKNLIFIMKIKFITCSSNSKREKNNPKILCCQEMKKHL